MIMIERQVGCSVPDEVFQQAAAACFLSMGISRPCALSLLLTDNARIRDINHTWRGMDQATDVLSFPSLSLAPDRLFNQDDPASLEAWDSETGAFYLGDIIISVDKAQEQSAQLGHGLRREMLYLFVHGLCHLLGFDHETREDQLHMRKQEELTLQAVTGELTPDDDQLLQAARAARAQAYVPYSNYRVGAALLCEDGRVFTGCNVENISYGLTNCAERTAVFKAVSEGAQRFEAIAIAADQTAPWPCGACRQVMSEFAPKLRVLVTWDGEQSEMTSLDRLLPHSFLSFQEDRNG